MGNKKQNAMIGYLCSRLKLDKETKEDMIFNHTDGRVTSTCDMNEQEARTLIGYLVKATGLPDAPGAKMRRKLLSMAHEMHWELPCGRVDIGRVNSWCIRFSGKNKPLDAFTYSELPALVTAFENVYRGFLKGI